MQALIGYLVAIVVFIGGGYAGVQWLTSPEDVPSAVAIQRSNEPVKSTRARLLARKKHQAAAEREANARPSDTVVTTEQAGMAAAPEAPRSEDIVSQAEPASAGVLPAAAPLSKEVASVVASPAVEQTKAPPASPATEVAANSDAVRTNHGASSEVSTDTARAPSAIERPVRRLALRPLSSVEKQVVRSALAREAADVAERSERRQTIAKKRRDAARLASTSHKPVLMILRTIEYPDGRREQRLLPMPRSRQAYAYAD